ncbi:hypothetical protein [Nitrosophilus alvini]|uniref:hypothetical protein n=1 Tax=Nitrosophilus alvini TaxID=2714855 RepID=UPI00190DD669|nr:hypothetical protein [Nitrosophilus alvini]
MGKKMCYGTIKYYAKTHEEKLDIIFIMKKKFDESKTQKYKFHVKVINFFEEEFESEEIGSIEEIERITENKAEEIICNIIFITQKNIENPKLLKYRIETKKGGLQNS